MPLASDVVHRVEGDPLDVVAILRASRRRRFLGAVGGGMVGSGMAGMAVSALNLWLSKPPALVWLGVAIGLPVAVAGAWMILRIGD